MEATDVVPRPEVYLLHQHRLLRLALRSLLEGSGVARVVGDTEDVRTAVARVPALRPDVLLLDAGLPATARAEACREVRERSPATGILVLGEQRDDVGLIDLIQAGATGYLLADADLDELAIALRRVARGQSVLDPQVTGAVLDHVRHAEQSDPEVDVFTPGERRILLLLADGLTNRQIAHEAQLSEKTVKNYVSDILGKLQVASRTQAAVFATLHRSSLTVPLARA
ncbi:LuxR C-terminal-related transcriptional regulator [Nocardioides bruguierae]|uniref:LuxR C-terminal-related transcriptional regulator n=1 Tax=Nocardioides bruguierae TaxID=2945102 RepID=UPI0020224F33|nr:response regulator transcription factor [Nocardioides bruguierae]MCL8027344.1 response regulator transcription factor [Nocardioides bruguierae]